jgi:predicted membrane-bound mannosyltransferase
MALFSILMMLIFSIMPYKTPWNILSSYFGLILLAGFGCIEVLNSFNKGMMRKTILIIMIAAALSLITQVIYTIYKYPSHPSNPYVYGHTSSDVFHIIDRINKVSEMNPEGKELLVQVICSNDDYWPLPWYLREYNQVGWWNKIDSNTPLSPLMVVSPDLKELLVKKMYVEPKPGEKYLYVPLFDEGTELRPGVLLDGYVRKDYFTDQGSNE